MARPPRYGIINEDDAQLWVGIPATGELFEMIPDDAEPREYLAGFLARRDIQPRSNKGD